ncbi:MAG TPA: 30S ribosomal protein S6 [Thermodesulfovibrionia bacterium]|nr:30S ribosomal protein S6 [Thermodesulfovibrionia bacterium]
MNHYEMITILNPSLNEEDTQKAIDRIKELLLKEKGIILKAENWGRRRLAYELNKQKEGIYFFLIFQAPPKSILTIERFYKVFDPVIKFMVIKLNQKEKEAVIGKLEPELQQAETSAEHEPEASKTKSEEIEEETPSV